MADMSEMLKSFSSMMEGKEIPDNIKEMLNSLQKNNSENSNAPANSNNNSSTNSDSGSNFDLSGFSNSNSSQNFNNNSSNNNSNFSQGIPNIDINTMLKMQKIMSAMNNSSNSSGANLLRSLKPYLKPSRQAKVDEYIQLFSIEKVIETMKKSGGDNKNDT